MAAEADGSVIIDTEIRKENAIDDIGSLKAALKELTAAVKELTSGLASSFTNFGSNAQGAASNIDSISDSAKTATDSVESLEEQMAKITVDRGFEPTYNDNPEPRFGHAKGEYIDYGNTVQEFVNKYAAGMDTVKAKNAEVKQSTTQATTAVKSDFQGTEQSPNMLSNAIELVKRSLLNIPAVASLAGGKIKDGLASGGDQAMNAAEKVDALKGKLDALEKQGLYFGNEEYDKTYAALQRAESELGTYKKQLSGADKEQKKVSSSGRKMNSSLRGTKKEADPLSKSIFKLSNMFKLMLIRMAMRAVIQSAKDGFQNLARYSSDANAAISAVVSSLTMLKNSFAVAVAPIVEIVAPILSRFITQLAEVNNWIAQTIAAMVGKDTYTKAIKVQEDYAASLTDTQKAAKDAADQAKKTTFAFDTLIQAQGGNKSTNEYKAPTPDQMFKTEQVSNDAKALAKDVKSTLSDLFKPIKDSWDEYGPYTTNAVKTMFSSLKQLAADVGASFMKVWKDEGYGKAITDDLIITFGNFALIIANLATQFDKAWVTADTGTSIMRHLGDIVLEITGFFREASKSIADWAANLDFTPLLTSFDNLLVSLIPIVGKIGDVLLWFLNNVLLPLAKWAIENLIPAALDLISVALDILNGVIDSLKPLAMWLWEDFIKPFGEWTGEIIIAALKGVADKLKVVSDWINENKEKVRYMTELVLAFFLAWKFSEFITGVQNMIKALSQTGLAGALANIITKLNLSKIGFAANIAAISALVVAAYEMYKNWSAMTPTEKLISGLLAAASAAAMLAIAMGAVTGAAGAALKAAAITAAIGAALIAINAGARAASSSSSYSSSYPTSAYSAYSSNVPQLATGTVVPPKAGNFLAMLGDNNKDYEVVSPLETMKQAFKEAIGEMGGMGGGTVQADMVLDGTKFGQLVYKYNNKESDRVGVRMVTNGG